MSKNKKIIVQVKWVNVQKNIRSFFIKTLFVKSSLSRLSIPTFSFPLLGYSMKNKGIREIFDIFHLLLRVLLDNKVFSNSHFLNAFLKKKKIYFFHPILLEFKVVEFDHFKMPDFFFNPIFNRMEFQTVKKSDKCLVNNQKIGKLQWKNQFIET